MQLITLTAPNGHSERWEPCLAVKALKLLYKYLSDPDQDTVNGLAMQVREFVGDDIQTVHSALVYAQSVQTGLFPKLALISNDGQRSMAQVYFTLKALDKSTPYHHGRQRPTGVALLDTITEVTGNDQETIKGLEKLSKLFVDGQLSYDSLEMEGNGQVEKCH